MKLKVHMYSGRGTPPQPTPALRTHITAQSFSLRRALAVRNRPALLRAATCTTKCCVSTALPCTRSSWHCAEISILTTYCSTDADGPQNITIAPQPAPGEDLSLIYGDMLVCAAIGNPDPVYLWECSDNTFHQGEQTQTTNTLKFNN